MTLRLPAFAAYLPAVSTYSHSVPSTFLHPPGASRFVSGALLCVWNAVAFYWFPRRPREIFAGALAISTYFAATSYDYNLITVYPLLLVVLQRALARPRPIDWKSWAVFFVGAGGDRRKPRLARARRMGPCRPSAHWLVLVAAWVAFSSDRC